MELCDILSLLVVAAAFAYLNQRFLHLPSTIGLMALTLLSSLGLVGLGRQGTGCLRLVTDAFSRRIVGPHVYASLPTTGCRAATESLWCNRAKKRRGRVSGGAAGPAGARPGSSGSSRAAGLGR